MIAPQTVCLIPLLCFSVTELENDVNILRVGLQDIEKVNIIYGLLFHIELKYRLQNRLKCKIIIFRRFVNN